MSKVFKLVKTNSALDFLKNNTSSAAASEYTVLFLIKSKASCFNYYIKVPVVAIQKVHENEKKKIAERLCAHGPPPWIRQYPLKSNGHSIF